MILVGRTCEFEKHDNNLCQIMMFFTKLNMEVSYETVLFDICLCILLHR